KIIGLIWLCYYAGRRQTWQLDGKDCQRMQLIYEIIEFVGKWSMIDIFVVAVISSLIRMGQLMSVYPDVGSVLFTFVVITTMIAALKFDTRLIWDRLSVKDEKRL